MGDVDINNVNRSWQFLWCDHLFMAQFVLHHTTMRFARSWCRHNIESLIEIDHTFHLHQGTTLPFHVEWFRLPNQWYQWSPIIPSQPQHNLQFHRFGLLLWLQHPRRRQQSCQRRPQSLLTEHRVSFALVGVNSWICGLLVLTSNPTLPDRSSPFRELFVDFLRIGTVFDHVAPRIERNSPKCSTPLDNQTKKSNRWGSTSTGLTWHGAKWNVSPERFSQLRWTNNSQPYSHLKIHKLQTPQKKHFVKKHRLITHQT